MNDTKLDEFFNDTDEKLGDVPALFKKIAEQAKNDERLKMWLDGVDDD